MLVAVTGVFCGGVAALRGSKQLTDSVMCKILQNPSRAFAATRCQAQDRIGHGQMARFDPLPFAQSFSCLLSCVQAGFTSAGVLSQRLAEGALHAGFCRSILN